MTLIPTMKVSTKGGSFLGGFNYTTANAQQSAFIGPALGAQEYGLATIGMYIDLAGLGSANAGDGVAFGVNGQLYYLWSALCIANGSPIFQTSDGGQSTISAAFGSSGLGALNGYLHLQCRSQVIVPPSHQVTVHASVKTVGIFVGYYMHLAVFANA